MAQPILTYDFTLKAYEEDDACEQQRLALIEVLNQFSRDWCFQLELSEGGYKHFQGRLKLKFKKRLSTLVTDFESHHGIHFSPTSSANVKNMFYVLKDDTRVEGGGPWKKSEEDTDLTVEKPRDLVAVPILRPFQEKLVKIAQTYEHRKINIVVDEAGGAGKTTLARYMMWHKYARMIPYCNDFRDILRMVMDMPKSTCYIIDMPRAISKERLLQFFGAIEVLKGGYAFEDRYKFRDMMFDPPGIIIYTNQRPDETLLTVDRWVLWQIINNDLVPYGSVSNLPDPEDGESKGNFTEVNPNEGPDGVSRGPDLPLPKIVSVQLPILSHSNAVKKMNAEQAKAGIEQAEVTEKIARQAHIPQPIKPVTIKKGATPVRVPKVRSVSRKSKVVKST